MAMTEQEKELFIKAGNKIKEQHALLERLTAPAYHVGTVIAVFQDRVVVDTGNQLFDLSKGKDFLTVKIGQSVDVHPETGQIVRTSEYVSYGSTGKIVAIDGDLVQVNIPSGLVTTSSSMVEGLAVGDKVVLNSTNHVVMHRLPEQSQYAFKTQSVLDWSDIGAQEEAKRELIEALETPFTHAALYQFYKKKRVKGCLLWGRPGNGKLLDVNELIPTPTGWVRNGDVMTGDVIFDETGNLAKVLAAHNPQYDETYRLTFDDGTEIIAGASHLWQTRTRRERLAVQENTLAWRSQRRQKRASLRMAKKKVSLRKGYHRDLKECGERQTSGTRTTEEIFRTLLVPGKDRVNHSIDLCAPLELPEVALPIEAYTFGYWLGDGGRHHGGFTIGKKDQKAVLGLLQEDLHVKPSDPIEFYAYGFKVKLRPLGVLDNKHIPMVYLRASIAQRTALLQGLMDSDGHVDQFGYCQWSSSHPPLVSGMSELLHSLGIKHEMCPKVATVKYKGRIVKCPTTRTTFSTAIQCFRLPRKAKRQKVKDFNGCSLRRYIVKMEKIEPKLMRCLTVDSPSHLYLAGRGMVPTHNTLLGRAAAGSLARHHGKDAQESGFIYIKGPEILDKYIGETEGRIGEAFDFGIAHFKKHGYPAVLFIDEADALLVRRGLRTTNGMEQTVVPMFNARMDGMEDSGVFVILATNRADILDPAIIRPGRIDRRVYVAPPTKENAPSIFNIHMRDVPVAGGVSKEQLIATTVDSLYSDKAPLYLIETEKNEYLKFGLGDLASGALIAGIVERASAIAINRVLAHVADGMGYEELVKVSSDGGALRAILGLTQPDFDSALEAIQKEQRGINHIDELREFVEVGKLEVKSVKICHTGEKIMPNRASEERKQEPTQELSTQVVVLKAPEDKHGAN